MDKHEKTLGSAWQKILGGPVYTRHVLITSTAHIPMQTDVALRDDESKDPGSLFNRLAYQPVYSGWHFYVSDHQVAQARESGHKELAGLLEMAQRLGYDRLELEADATPLPAELGMPTFEW